MIVALAMVVAVLVGSGLTLLLSRDLFRVVGGVILLSNAINLFLLAAGRAPLTSVLDPLGEQVAADPLVQALALTAVVITFGTAALLLGLVLQFHATHGSIGTEVLAKAEREEEEEAEAEREEI